MILISPKLALAEQLFAAVGVVNWLAKFSVGNLIEDELKLELSLQGLSVFKIQSLIISDSRITEKLFQTSKLLYKDFSWKLFPLKEISRKMQALMLSSYFTK